MRSRVLSGMRPTGALHLGHYHGALKNWVRLQSEHDCLFFVADWHALTTHYSEVRGMESHVYDMVVDWLAAGLDPDRCTLFIQSRMPEHAELFTLLAMSTPLSWLERVPSFKEQLPLRTEAAGHEPATYGFLGYPLLQAADILIYKAQWVPVGEDQSAHVELTREVARRFNQLYGRSPDARQRIVAALSKMGREAERDYERQRRAYGQTGDTLALERGLALVQQASQSTPGWSPQDSEVLSGHLKGAGRSVLQEPQALHTEVLRLPGTDGQKMSKSLGNSVLMRDTPEAVQTKIRAMATDPARVRRSDPGTPERCPVWAYHRVYSSADAQATVHQACTQARVGCLECKQPVIDAIVQQQANWHERADRYLSNPKQVHWMLETGTERARALARQTLKEVRSVMGLVY
jgi:tryptophanyl-tRNA synthetase